MTTDSTNEGRFLPDRRQLLAGAGATAGLALAGSALGPRSMHGRAPTAAPSLAPRALIVVFLRGGADQLTWVAPVTDPYYHTQRRPGIAVPIPAPTDRRWLNNASGQNDGFALPLSATNTAVANIDLKVPFDNGDLTFVHGAGLRCSPSGCGNTKSHFEAMNYVENGVSSGAPLLPNGWLARYLNHYMSSQSLRGVAHGPLLPRSLAGSSKVIPVKDVAMFPFPGRAITAAKRREILVEMYVNTQEPTFPSPLLKSAGTSALDAQAILASVNHGGAAPQFPATPFGEALRKTANILNQGVTLEAVHIDYGGWDHHNNLDPNNPALDPGKFYTMSRDVSQAMAAFYYAMGGTDPTNPYTMVVMTEFGRRVVQNQSGGTDHGTGGLAMVMGSGVAQGSYARRVYFKNWIPWNAANPTVTGLRSPNVLLYPGTSDEDIAIGIDLREVLGEILVKQFGLNPAVVFGPATNPALVFPGVAAPNPWAGIVG